MILKTWKFSGSQPCVGCREIESRSKYSMFFYFLFMGRTVWRRKSLGWKLISWLHANNAFHATSPKDPLKLSKSELVLLVNLDSWIYFWTCSIWTNIMLWREQICDNMRVYVSIFKLNEANGLKTRWHWQVLSKPKNKKIWKWIEFFTKGVIWLFS